MANHYLLFSEALPLKTKAQEDWVYDQLKFIAVVDGKEMLSSDYDLLVDPKKPTYDGIKFLRDYPPEDVSDEVGFECTVESISGKRQAWLHTDESGDVGKVVHFVRKFLKKFNPTGCWTLTYAATCSKPRLGEFGGGGVFVTANSVKWTNAYDFIEKCKKAFETKKSKAELEVPG